MHFNHWYISDTFDCLRFHTQIRPKPLHEKLGWDVFPSLKGVPTEHRPEDQSNQSQLSKLPALTPRQDGSRWLQKKNQSLTKHRSRAHLISSMENMWQYAKGIHSLACFCIFYFYNICKRGCAVWAAETPSSAAGFAGRSGHCWGGSLSQPAFASYDS